MKASHYARCPVKQADEARYPSGVSIGHVSAVMQFQFPVARRPFLACFRPTITAMGYTAATESDDALGLPSRMRFLNLLLVRPTSVAIVCFALLRTTHAATTYPAAAHAHAVH